MVAAVIICRVHLVRHVDDVEPFVELVLITTTTTTITVSHWWKVLAAHLQRLSLQSLHCNSMALLLVVVVVAVALLLYQLHHVVLCVDRSL